MEQTRKNLMNWMVALAAGSFMFVMLVVLAAAVGANMGGATSMCASGYTYNTTALAAANSCYGCTGLTAGGYAFNFTAGNNTCCAVNGNGTAVAEIFSNPSQATYNAFFIIGQLGSGGLSGYLPLIFIAAIAIGILAMMGMGIGRKGKY